MQQTEKTRSRLFEELILKSWWLILFLFLSTFAYEQASIHKQNEKTRLLTELESIKKSILVAQAEQDELLLQIESRDDSRWIEMVLMKRLGLVPEGAIKIHFSSNEL